MRRYFPLMYIYRERRTVLNHVLNGSVLRCNVLSASLNKTLLHRPRVCYINNHNNDDDNHQPNNNTSCLKLNCTAIIHHLNVLIHLGMYTVSVYSSICHYILNFIYTNLLLPSLYLNTSIQKRPFLINIHLLVDWHVFLRSVLINSSK